MNKKNRPDANSPEHDVGIRRKTNWKKLPATNYQDDLKREYIDSWLNTGNIHIAYWGRFYTVYFLNIRFDCKAKLNEMKSREKIKFKNNKIEFN